MSSSKICDEHVNECGLSHLYHRTEIEEACSFGDIEQVANKNNDVYTNMKILLKKLFPGYSLRACDAKGGRRHTQPNVYRVNKIHIEEYQGLDSLTDFTLALLQRLLSADNLGESKNSRNDLDSRMRKRLVTVSTFFRYRLFLLVLSYRL